MTSQVDVILSIEKNTDIIKDRLHVRAFRNLNEYVLMATPANATPGLAAVSSGNI